jgi:hypothetical protein
METPKTIVQTITHRDYYKRFWSHFGRDLFRRGRPQIIGLLLAVGFLAFQLYFGMIPAAQAIYRLRGAVAEFPNAWLKAKIGLRQFRVRGLKKVRGEALWACLAYNLLQWVRLRWKVRLAEAKS